MKIELKDWWIRGMGSRIIQSKRKSSFLGLSALLSTGGILLGVGVILIVLCVMRGFQFELEKRLVSTDLHILISPTSSFQGFEQGFVPASNLSGHPALIDLKNLKQVKRVSIVLSTEAVIRMGSKVAGAQVRGVDEQILSTIEGKAVERALPQMLLDRDSPDGLRLPGIWLGKEMAYDLSAIPGDLVTLTSPSVMEGPLGNIPRVKRFVIEGIYSTGVPEQELHQAFTLSKNVESFLRKRDRANEVSVTLHDPFQSIGLANTIQKLLPDAKVQSWAQLNGNLFASMKLERFAMFLILLFSVLIATLNIVSTVSLIVQERRKEIGILRTLGAKEGTIGGMFLFQGIRLGGVGVVGGVFLAILVCWVLKTFPIIQLPEVYYDRRLPVVMDPFYFVSVGVIAFLIVVIAAWIPAMKAAKLSPLDVIRFQIKGKK